MQAILEQAGVVDESAIRVLVVDDNRTNRMVLTALLKRHDYEILSAENGQQAVELFERERPVLVLMDVMMPVMDGYEAAELLANDPRLDGIPIIALTAKAMMGDRDRCLEAGCDDYLAKPVARKALLEMVGHWLEANDAEWMAARRSRRMSA